MALLAAPGMLAQAPVTPVAPETFHERFMNFAVKTTGPRALFSPLISAAVRMAHPPEAYPRAWKDGPGALGRNYGNDLASRSALETGRFLTGAILHEDFRYRPSGSQEPLARMAHALAFTFVDRSDSGHARLAVSNFVAAGAGGFVGEWYLPHGFNNLSHAESRTAIEFGRLAGGNLLREFSPELRDAARHLHLPFHGFPVPEWWVRR